jgi:electron transfer flavoprotein alpha subunit
MLGLSKIYTIDGPLFESYSSEGYVEALAAAGEDWGCDVYLIGATALGRDLSARLAARLGAALATDVTEIDWDSEQTRVVRPIYSGKLLAEIQLETDVKVISIRPNVFAAAEEHDQPAEVTALTLADPTIKATVKEALEAAQDVLDVSEADIIVSGGRGVGGPEGFKVIEDLAKAVGGAVGASRVAVDEGWIPYVHQVGQTGKVVTPVLYIACGISGAIQHFAGMGSSKFIIAINKDPDAPIMKKADFAIVGDLFKVIPLLKDELIRARQA